MQQWAKSSEASIVINLTRKRIGKGYSKWRIEVIEDWPNQNSHTSSSLDSRVIWITEKLESWNTTRRTAWNIWEFDSKREAEKFLTLYNLVWA